MRNVVGAVLLAAVMTAGAGAQSAVSATAAGPKDTGARVFLGFDANLYPGDKALATLSKRFAYVGYWLNIPPGEDANSWRGKRGVLRAAGFGFLVLFNGHEEREFVRAAHGRRDYAVAAKAMGERDAKAAIARASEEGFPAGTVIFLDIEEGGRMEAGQVAYLFAWSEAVARSAYKPGAYCSGQPVDDGGGLHITTAEDIEQQVAEKHLHSIALWIAQDACPPAPGCVTDPPALSKAGIGGIEVWQYAQSPRRRSITLACAKTYTKGACVVPELPGVEMDLDAAGSADPSRGR